MDGHEVNTTTSWTDWNNEDGSTHDSKNQNVLESSPAFTSDKMDEGILLSQDIEDAVQTVVQVGLLPFLVTWGVSTNIINMVAFVRLGLADRVNVCLFSLSVAEAGYLVSLFTVRVYSIIGLVDAELGRYWRSVNYHVYGVYTGFLNVANVLTMIIALDRCVCVTRPLNAKLVIRTRWISLIIILLFVFVLGLCSLQGFRYRLHLEYDNVTNTSDYIALRTDFYYDYHTFLDVLNNYVFNVITPTVCVVIVAVTTTVTGVTLKRARSWRLKESLGSRQGAGRTSSGSREASVTRMLVTVCLIYTVCTAPWVAMAIARKAVPGFTRGRYQHVFYVTNTIMHLLVAINASINFLVYFSHGTKFRVTVKSMFACPHQENRKLNISVSQTSLKIRNGNAGKLFRHSTVP